MMRDADVEIKFQTSTRFIFLNPLSSNQSLRFYMGTQSMAWELNRSQPVSGFPASSDGKESTCNADTQIWSLG